MVPASAANNIKPFGQQETLNDYGTGAPMIGYTVMGLSPSSDAVPHNGQLYAATVTVEGLGGWATPLVPLFNARAESGQNYRVIGGGVAAAPPGGSTTGTLYFDVVGDTPNSVVYNDGVQDLLVWVFHRWPISSGAPDVAGESTENIGGAPTGGGGEVASAPAEAPAPPRSSRRPPSSSPNRRWLSQGSMQFPAGIADCSVTYGRSRNGCRTACRSSPPETEHRGHSGSRPNPGNANGFGPGLSDSAALRASAAGRIMARLAPGEVRRVLGQQADADDVGGNSRQLRNALEQRSAAPQAAWPPGGPAERKPAGRGAGCVAESGWRQSATIGADGR